MIRIFYPIVKDKPLFETLVAETARTWETCRGMTADEIENDPEFASPISLFPANEDDISVEIMNAFDAWTFEELLALRVHKGRQCSFCGTRATVDRVLQTCGRCKGAFYCDSKCQTMHWKDHKPKCVEKAASES
jgi:hypothetical protein